jgi:hypothetical protein
MPRSRSLHMLSSNTCVVQVVGCRLGTVMPVRSASNLQNCLAITGDGKNYGDARYYRRFGFCGGGFRMSLSHPGIICIRHVEPLSICTTCGAYPETTYHAREANLIFQGRASLACGRRSLHSFPELVPLNKQLIQHMFEFFPLFWPFIINNIL